MLQFAKKAVIITGASSGIGEAAALAFAKDGAKLTITGRNKERLAGVADECRKFDGCEVHEIVSDLADFDNLKPIIHESVEKFKGIDILVNNAAAGAPVKPIEDLELDKYNYVFNTNLRAPVFLSKFALPHLKKSKGCVVNVSSAATEWAVPKKVPYCMSKIALDHFTRGLAAECAEFGVRVNSVNPGISKTRFHTHLDLNPEELKRLREMYKSMHSLGIVPVDEVVKTIMFVCSSTHMTGSSVFVDGGSLLSR